MIYIIDSSPHLSEGHHWVVDRIIRRALRELQLAYVFINPSANLAKSEDLISESDEYRYIQVENHDSIMNDVRNWIQNDLCRKGLLSAVILIPWLPQFNETSLKELLLLQEVIDLSIVGITMHSLESMRGDTTDAQYQFQELFERESAFKILWVGDNIPDSLTSKDYIRQWPGYAESFPARKNEGRLSIGFFGMLSAERGLGEMLILALFNPKLSVIIRGYSFRRLFVWKPSKYSYLRYSNWREKRCLSLCFAFISILISNLRFLPNVSFSDKPFATEDELSYAISECSAVFYCPKLISGSGITMKCLAGGTPVVWNGIEGYAVDVLRNSFPEGFFRYRDLFVPNRITSKILSFQGLTPTSPYDWPMFVREISELSRFLK